MFKARKAVLSEVQRGSPGPILTALAKCPEDGATRKKRNK